MKTLVIGGSGPTGPHIVDGLASRGHEVTILHRGEHELPELETFEHIHADPFDRMSLTEALASRKFDIAIAMYGRVRTIVDVLEGHCDHLITISGIPVYAGYFVGTGGPLPTPIREFDPLVEEQPDDLPYPVMAVRRTEEKVLSAGRSGAYGATVLRYSTVYGPRVPHPWDWLTVKRILAGRTVMALPDGGLSLHSRIAVENAAAFVLAAVDNPATVANQVYNVADARQYSLREWTEQIGRAMGAELDLVSVPGDVPVHAWGLFPFGYPALSAHALLDISKAEAELGYEDAVAPLDALTSMVEWFLANPDAVQHGNLPEAPPLSAEEGLLGAWRQLATTLPTQVSGPYAAMATPQRSKDEK